MRAPPESLRPISGRSAAHSQIHDLADFSRVGFRERAAEHGEVLRENVHQPSVNAAKSSDKAITRRTLLLHSEIDAIVADKFVQLFESVFVEQEIYALASGKLAGFVFTLAALRAAAGFRFSRQFPQFLHATAMRGLTRGSGFLLVRQADLPRFLF